MSVRLNGSTSGYTELDAQASPGNNTLKFPASNGSARQVMRNGATPGTLEFADALVLMTAQNSTSGTSIDFTGIPSWVKRVTVMFNGVSTNGASNLLIQIGDSGGIETSGYTASSAGADTGVAVSTYTTGFGIRVANAGNLLSGHLFFTAIGSNVWICSGTISSPLAVIFMVAGTKTLSDTLDRIRITTVNGTDTFDAGTINVMYE
jgi:hypothetical protein